MKDYSNYHNININEKISHDGLLLLENSLDGFEGYDVLINNSINSRMLVYQKYDADSNIKKVIGKIEDIELGNVLNINGLNWLITTFPEDNKIYRKAEIQLCNSTYPIISGNKTRELLGYDQFDKPQYHYVYEVNKQEPCIVEMGIVVTDTNAQLVIPKNNIHITIKYQPSETLKENYVFTMYNSNYKITDIDYTKVINDKGIDKGVIKIMAERE